MIASLSTTLLEELNTLTTSKKNWELRSKSTFSMRQSMMKMIYQLIKSNYSWLLEVTKLISCMFCHSLNFTQCNSHSSAIQNLATTKCTLSMKLNQPIFRTKSFHSTAISMRSKLLNSLEFSTPKRNWKVNIELTIHLLEHRHTVPQNIDQMISFNSIW